MLTSPGAGRFPLHPMANLRIRGEYIVSEYGAVEELRSEIHQPGTGRPCIHAVRVPIVFAVTQSVVESLHWQPRIFDGDSKAPCIASIRSGVLTIAFDMIGPVPPNEGHRTHRQGESPPYRYEFNLHPVRWFDEDEPMDGLFLAVRRRLVVDNV